MLFDLPGSIIRLESYRYKWRFSSMDSTPIIPGQNMDIQWITPGQVRKEIPVKKEAEADAGVREQHDLVSVTMPVEDKKKPETKKADAPVAEEKKVPAKDKPTHEKMMVLGDGTVVTAGKGNSADVPATLFMDEGSGLMGGKMSTQMAAFIGGEIGSQIGRKIGVLPDLGFDPAIFGRPLAGPDTEFFGTGVNSLSSAKDGIFNAEGEKIA